MGGNKSFPRSGDDSESLLTNGHPASLAVDASASVSKHTASNTPVNAASYSTVVDKSVACAHLGTTIHGLDAGYRLTVDGTVVVDATASAQGRDGTTNQSSVAFVPPAVAQSSLKVEAYNAAGTSNDMGWRGATIDL